MLSNTLVTNEVKNAAGTEKEFQRISSFANSTEFALIGEAPAYPHRLLISHQESGSGINRKRRSRIRFDLTAISDVDATVVGKTSAYIVLEAPVGAYTTTAKSAEVLANLMSLVASLGASTTILYDGTGNGAVTLMTGGL